MEFCPHCRNLLVFDKKKNVLVCRRCGYIKNACNIEEKIVEKITTSKETLIIKQSDSSEEKILPKTKAECSKCGNKEAYYWMMQTRRADEPPTRFYRCTKCGHTWREYE